MGKHDNIRTASAQDVQALIAKGFRFVVVQGRGADRGRIVSRHKTDAAAQKAAKPYSWLCVENLCWIQRNLSIARLMRDTNSRERA